MHKIILDTDIGDDIDDALALAYALMCGEIELLGVTTVFRDTVRRAELACCLLEALGRSDVGVYAGLGKPLLDPVAEGRAAIAAHRPPTRCRRSSGTRHRRGPPTRAPSTSSSTPS